MPSTVEKLSPARVKLTIEVPFTELQPSLDKAYAAIAQRIDIPGFRKGKVPNPVIDQRVGRGAVLNDAVNEALPEAYSKAVAEHGLQPLDQPDVEVTKLEDGDVLEFTAEVDVRPDFDLPELDGLSVQVDPIDVDDARVDEQIELLRQRFATQKTVERAAADGDIVTMDIVAKQGGESSEDDEAAEDITYQIGSGGMLDGLDEALQGLSAGESATFSSTLVGGPLQGEKSDITVTVKKVAEQELPEIDDEFAQEASGLDSLEDMKRDLRTAVEGRARLGQAAAARDKALEAILAATEIPVPEQLLERETQTRHQQIQAELAQAGLTVDQYLAEAEGEDASDAEEFWKTIDERSEQAIKAQFVLDRIADEREIGVGQDDLTQYVINRAQQEGVAPEQVAQQLSQPDAIGGVMQEIRRGKALAEILQQVTVTDTEGAPVDVANLRPDGSIAEPEAEASEAGETEETTSA